MIEEPLFKVLSNYGVLGIWTATLMLDKYYYRKKGIEDKKMMEEVIKDNTKVMSAVLETLRIVRR